MRSGEWLDTAVRSTAVQVTLGGKVVDVDRVSISSETSAELREVGAGANASAAGDVEWSEQAPLSSTSPQPFLRAGASWPPAPTVAVLVDVGDGAGQMFRKFTGRVDVTTGSISEARVSSRLVDLIDKLSMPIHHDPLLAQMPPDADFQPYRYVGLSGTYVTDMCARRSGFYATSATSPRTLLSAPCQGSLWPEVGRIVTAEAFENVSNIAPSWRVAPWGLAPHNVSAEWEMTEATTSAVLTVSLLQQHAGVAATVSWVDADGVGAFITHDAADNLRMGVMAPAYTIVQTVPRDGATKAALFANRSVAGQLELTMHTSDGRIVNEVVPGANLSGPGQRVVLAGDGALGGIVVDKASDAARLWDAVQEAPTAVFRVRDIQYLDAMPTLTGEKALDLITEQATAEAATFWLDADGVFRWAGRGILDSDPVVAVKSTTVGVDDLSWTDDLTGLRQQVTLRRRQPAISRYTESTVKLTDISEQTLSNGQTVEQWLDPGGDEDWIYPDLDMTYLGSGTVGAIHRGSYCGATITPPTNSEELEVWAAPVDQITVKLEQVGTTYKLTQKATNLPPDRVAVTRILESTPNLARWVWGAALPIFRGRGRVHWTDQADTQATVATNTRVSYEHPCEWWVQSPVRRDSLGDWLAGMLGRARPTVDRIEIDPDPRLELGDKITVRDPARTGLELDLVVTRIDESWGAEAPQMTLSGRVTRIARPSTPTDPTSTWELLLTGWREQAA